MTNAFIPLADTPRGAATQPGGINATPRNPNAEPKGPKLADDQSTRPFNEALTSARRRSDDAAQSTHEHADPAPTDSSRPQPPDGSANHEEPAETDAAPREETPAPPLHPQSEPSASADAPTPALALAPIEAQPAQAPHPQLTAAHAESLPSPPSTPHLAPSPAITPQTPRPAAEPAGPTPIDTDGIPSSNTSPPSEPTPTQAPTNQHTNADPQSNSTTPPESPAPSPPTAAIPRQPDRAPRPLQRSSPDDASAPINPLPSAPPQPVNSAEPAPTSVAPIAPESPERNAAPRRALDAPTRNSDSIFHIEPVTQSAPAIHSDSNQRPTTSPPSLNNSQPHSPQPSQDTPPAPQLVARGLTAALAQRGGVIHVRLVPVSLGEVQIHMQLDAGAVSVRIDAATPAAQNLLNDHLALLRNSLESRGLQVDRLAVSLTPAPAAPQSGTTSQNHSNSDPSQSAPNNQQQDAAGSQSRGRSDDHQDRTNQAPDAQPRDDRQPTTTHRNFNSRLRMRLSTVA
ncbi:MAG: flagellar hook-length control protein FliK [Phycisphaerae bacterium]|nr:flagellar hook-length control protein FliK [Phycisphaerae bacterium]